jgi:type IV pilus assembly protein PilM
MSVLGSPISMPRLRVPRRPAGSRRGPTVTGLEIGATQAIAARAHLHDGRITTERAAARSLPPGLLRDGVVIDPDGLAHELRALFAEHHFAKRVRVGLATPRTVLRVIDLPPLEDRDVRAALLMQAQERIPMPLDRAVMDFQTVGLVDTPAGPRLRVIVVATERDGVERLLEALRGAGLKAVGIDLSIFAVIRALRDDERAEGPVLYAQLGDLANIAIAESGVCRFTRLAPQGLATLLERLTGSEGIPTDQALALLQRTGTERPGEEADADTREQMVGDLVARTASDLGSELRKATEFYSTQYGSGSVNTGMLAGPLTTIPGFVDALAAASGLELTCGEVTVATAAPLGDVDARLAPLASGLAVGGLGR